MQKGGKVQKKFHQSFLSPYKYMLEWLKRHQEMVNQQGSGACNTNRLPFHISSEETTATWAQLTWVTV